MTQVKKSKVRTLQPNVKEANKEDYSDNEELIKRENIKDSPFEIITRDGYNSAGS